MQPDRFDDRTAARLLRVTVRAAFPAGGQPGECAFAVDLAGPKEA